MNPPDIEEFHAFENQQPPGPTSFYVIGKVKTHAGNLLPILRDAAAPSLNPTLLLLDLTIEDNGEIGTKDIAFRDARYDHKGEYEGFSQVDILFNGELIVSLTPQIVS